MSNLQKTKLMREDDIGAHRTAFDRNKRKIYSTRGVCGICGKPVDFSLKYPNPLSPTIDHIIPIARGGHPSDLENLQLAHLCCNRQKSDRLMNTAAGKKLDGALIANRNLPQTRDWSEYRATED